MYEPLPDPKAADYTQWLIEARRRYDLLVYLNGRPVHMMALTIISIALFFAALRFVS